MTDPGGDRFEPQIDLVSQMLDAARDELRMVLSEMRGDPPAPQPPPPEAPSSQRKADLDMTEPISPAAPEGAAGALTRKLDDVVAEAQALRLDVKDAEIRRQRQLAQQAQQIAQLRRVSKVTQTILAVLLVFVVGLGVVAVIGGRTLALMTDCVSEGGECHERGARQTGAVIGRLEGTQLYIVECSRELGDGAGPAWDARFEKCVEGRRSPQPAPSPTTTGRPR